MCRIMEFYGFGFLIVLRFRRPVTIHPPTTSINIQRPPIQQNTATRITLPSNPAVGAQKAQAPHTVTQVSDMTQTYRSYLWNQFILYV